MENNRKRTLISAILALAVVASFFLVAVEVNSGGMHILFGLLNWVIQIAALSVLIYKHLTNKL